MRKLLSFALSLVACATLNAQTQVTSGMSGTELQAAIDAAESGTTVYVEAGTYYGNFTMKEGVNVSGGWNSTFTAQTDYATILDAQASGRVVNQPAAFSVLTVWSNLTIQNGNVTGTGGGVVLFKDGQLNHCKVMNNVCTTQGGGVYCDDSNAGVIVEDCIISHNTANQGGGMRIRGTVQNSTIENNTITDAGGGIHLQAGTAINCVVRNNSSKAGAGIRAYGGLVQNCIIEGNSTSTSNTGGVYLQQGAQMYNCIIRNNTSGENTGGVRMTFDSSKPCTIANCLVVGNSAAQTIGGLSLEGGIHYVYNNTIVNNNQTLTTNANRCGVRLNVNSNLVFANNIVWGNKANNSVQSDQMEVHATYASDRAATYFLNNAIVHAEIGTNTSVLTSINPGFTDVDSGDYTLLSSSALVDAGDNAKKQGLYDLAGSDRISGSTIDIGAYEYQYPVIVDNYVHADEDLQEAIDATSPGDTVFVESGTYYGNFTMKEGVNVSGGWNSDFTAQTDYATVLDAQASGRVVNQQADFSMLTVWENLTIQNGKLTSMLTDQGGAGVWLCKNGQVKHCIIQDNTFTYSGTCMGGGVGNNSVAANTDILIDDCIIRRNTATHGGGVRIKGTIQNSIIENNSTTNNAGGGAHMHTGRMVNCIVRGNTSGHNTGGVRMYGKGQLINSLIVNNTAVGEIGGVSIESANSDVIGCTIVGNNQQKANATVSKCGLSCGATADNGTKLANNVIWGNKHQDVAQEAQIYYISHYAAANRVYNAFAHQNTTHGIKLSMSNDEDDEYVDSSENSQVGLAPHFSDPENGDYRLTGLSPMFNKGSNDIASTYGITLDLSGEARVKGSIVDMGCYEQDAVTLAIDYEHLTLTLGGGIREAGNLSIPKGYTAAAQAVPAEGYYLSAITLNGVALTFDAEGQFTLPAITADATLAIDVVSMTTYERDVVSGNYGTICLPYAVSAADIIGCTPYRVLSLSEDGNGVILEQIDEMEAGKPYYFEASADHVSFGYVALGDAAEASSENGLYGTITGTTVSGAGKYIIQDNELRQTYNESASSAVAVELSGNRAYLLLSEVPAYVTPAPSARLRTLAIHREPQTPTAIDAAAVSGKWTKSIRNGQLVIERDGHVMNALGQELR